MSLLDAVRNGKLTLDTPLVMSARAARMPPSKMGFRPGTEVTLDNALKMLMVKSPNDVAVMVAEGVCGLDRSLCRRHERRQLHLTDASLTTPTAHSIPPHAA